MTNLNIYKLRKRADKALDHIGRLCTGEDRWKMTVPPEDDDSDMLLTAVAGGLKECLDRLERAEAAIERVRAVHRKMTIYRHEDLCPNTSEEHREEQHSDWGADPGEYYCLDLVEDYCCEACSEGKDPYEYWPCPTVAAIGDE